MTLVSMIRKEIIETRAFPGTNHRLQIDKATALMDILEISKRKYTELVVICKPEGFTIPT